MPPDLLKLAAEVGPLPSPAMPEPKPMVPYSMGAPSSDWGQRLKRKEELKEYTQYSRDGKSFLLDKDIPMLQDLGEGEAGLEAIRKAIRSGTDTDWTHPQVAIPGDVDLLKRFPSFQKSVLPAIRLPGEPRGGDTWRSGRLHAHRYGPTWLMHEDEHAPQSPRIGNLRPMMKLRETLTLEAARHIPEAGKAQVRRYRALRPVVVDSPRGKWEREKTSSAAAMHSQAVIEAAHAHALRSQAPRWFAKVRGAPARHQAEALRLRLQETTGRFEEALNEAKRLGQKEVAAPNAPYYYAGRLEAINSRADASAEKLQQFAESLQPEQMEGAIRTARLQALLGGAGFLSAATAPAVSIPLGVSASNRKQDQEKVAQNPPPPQPEVDPTGNMWGLAGGAGTLLAGGLAGRAFLPQAATSRAAQHLLTDAQLATARDWAARKGMLGGAILAAIPAWQVAKMVANSPRRNTAWQHQVFGF
jgi:hypothetical protein